MYDDALAWSGSATLENIVDYQQDSHHCHHHSDEIFSSSLAGDQGAELVAPSECEVYGNGGAESDHKVPSCVSSIGNHSVYELGNSVDDSYE